MLTRIWWLSVLWCGCAATHATAPARPAERPISVLSYNVLFNSERNTASLTAIERSNADVLCLTEVSSGFKAAFERALSQRYPHRAFRPHPGVWGLAVISRWPLSGVSTFAQRPSQRPGLEATVATPSGPLTVLCLHLMPPLALRKEGDGLFASLEKTAKFRKQQADHLTARYASRRGPMLVAGDLNEEPDDAAVNALESAGFERSCDVPNHRCGNTFPGAVPPYPPLFGVPRVRYPAIWELDHILGRGVDFHSARVIREGGSDHYPVFATFVPK